MIIIDRFENGWAVMEFGGRSFNFPRSLLPQGAREGDVVKITITIDDKGTKERKKYVEKLAGELFEE